MSETSFRPLAAKPAAISANWLITGSFEGGKALAPLEDLDRALGGALHRLRERGELQGKPGELVYLPVAPGIRADRLIIVGLGKPEALTLSRLEQAFLGAARKAAGSADSSIAWVIPEPAETQLGHSECCALAAFASIVAAVPPGLYKAEQERHPFREVLVSSSAAEAESSKALEQGRILGEAVNLTRELVNRHPEEIYPESFAARALSEATRAGIQAESFDLARLHQERMNALLAVARGSSHEPRVVILRYSGGPEGTPWLALCGKGVTFDSGGYSLKPSAGMLSMKGDMAGAATVLAAMVAIARLRLPVNVLGALGLVENMVGPHSYKLGEVLTARNGVTIEVQNTDAEGRLVLADVLSFAVDQRPAHIIDLATLTGSCVVALGEDVAGAFTNHQAWCDEVLAAARRAGEDVWQLPMFESYAEQLKCDVADVKNVGGKWGGAITAAKFLEKFVGEVPWVHLDIAGPSFAEMGKPWRDSGATGSSVRTLVEVARGLVQPKAKK